MFYKSLGVDLGDVRTGVAVSFKGVATEPLAVLILQGEQLADRLLHLAEEEGADEFVVGIPLHWTNAESQQALRCREFACLLASKAAGRGLRVYLHNEWKSTSDARRKMLSEGVKKQARRSRVDAYAASVLLDLYFDDGGRGSELVARQSLSRQDVVLKSEKAL